MKRKYIVAIVVQSVVILLMLIYSFYQKAIADEQLIRAEVMRRKAELIEKVSGAS